MPDLLHIFRLFDGVVWNCDSFVKLLILSPREPFQDVNARWRIRTSDSTDVSYVTALRTMHTRLGSGLYLYRGGLWGRALKFWLQQRFPNSRTCRTLRVQVRQNYQVAGPKVRDIFADLLLVKNFRSDWFPFGPAIFHQSRTECPTWLSEFS